MKRLLPLLLLSTAANGFAQLNEIRTVVVPGPFPTVPVVRHQELWHYAKGNLPPQPNWKTVADGELINWQTGPGGFGYGDGDDATVMSDMQNNYTTIYIRKTFSLSGTIDPAYHLILQADYDDGFVAFINGVEVARRFAGSPNSGEPLWNAVASGLRESSAGGGPPPEQIDLGPASRFGPGTHILAVMGLNQATASSDLSLIIDLKLGIPEPPEIPGILYLSRHDEIWRYFKGHTAPPANWQTIPESSISGWSSGPGGFGYGDGDDNTNISDVNVAGTERSLFTTVYIRRSFSVPAGLDPSLDLRLMMDYDDGFVAYLDGQEIARNMAPGSPGQEPANTATATGDHEATAGGGAGVESFPLGKLTQRLTPGNHILALIGLNRAADSSDFSLIPNLVGIDPATEKFFALVRTNSITLRAYVPPGITRVRINGQEAVYNNGVGRWERTMNVVPNMNRILIEAFDFGSVPSLTQTQLVIYEASTTTVGGTLSGNTSWNLGSGVVRVTNDVVIPSGGNLSIGEGSVLLISPGKKLMTSAGGIITAAGSASNRVYLLPSDGSTAWGSIQASGSNGKITLQQVEMVAGSAQAASGGILVVENSLLRNFKQSASGIVDATGAASVTIRRTIISQYNRAVVSGGRVEVEESLFEAMSEKGLKVHQSTVGSLIRQNTFSDADGYSVDGIEVTKANGLVVEGNWFQNIPFQAILIGDSSRNVTVAGNIIQSSQAGISVADGSAAEMFHNTVYNCSMAARFFSQSFNLLPGTGTLYNNIFWNCSTPVSLENEAAILSDHNTTSSFEPLPGEGNSVEDPLFFEPFSGDFRLAQGSSAAGTGRGGVDRGAVYPVGGRPAAPRGLSAKFVNNNVEVKWTDASSNESAFVLERGFDTNNWVEVQSLAANAVAYLDTGLNPNTTYYYRLKAVNFLGSSFYSNIGSTDGAADNDGDGMPNEYEILYDLDPANPADAHEDKDQDGISNLDEYMSGTNPNDSSSRLQFISISRDGQTAKLRFEAVADRTYTILFKSSLSQPSWQRFRDISAAAVTRVLEESDSDSKTIRFYRLVTPAVP